MSAAIPRRKFIASKGQRRSYCFRMTFFVPSTLRPALAAVFCFGALFAAAAGETWPQWRGPARDGHSEGPKWPESLDAEHLREMWRVPLGASYSGPVVDATRVFTTESPDKKHEAALAFDRRTGKQLWREEWEGGMSVPFFAKSNGDWIRSTPALDGDRLYVAGMKDVLLCLDASDGRIVWRKDFVADLKSPVPAFGFVSSPLVDGGAVYVQAAAAVVKLDKKTGEILWRSLADDGGMMGSAFSSPVIETIAGKRQLIVQTREKLAGISLEKGEVLWSQEVPAFRGMNILTPVYHEGKLYTSTYGGKTNAYEVTRQGEAFSVAPAWTHNSQGYMSTPVIIDGVAYTHLKSQRLMASRCKRGRNFGRVANHSENT
jgi:outer membrane protein assembly factor BamB